MTSSLELREWLVTEAGLKGRKLEDTLQKCRAGLIEDVDDLRMLVARPAHFKDQFPAALTRALIEEALANGTAPSDSPKTDIVGISLNDTPATPSTKIGAPRELPEGKR